MLRCHQNQRVREGSKTAREKEIDGEGERKEKMIE
jgi:hypothetical protein